MKKKCGIVTFHSAHNYGSVLQSFALERTIADLGFDVEIVDFRHPHTTEMYEWHFWSSYKSWKWNLKEFVLRGLLKFGLKREQIFQNFINTILILSKRIYSIKDVPRDYDFLICGSDQIWNPNASGENHPIYFLDFDTSAKKISYAASSGTKEFGHHAEKLYMKRLKALSVIGVREQFMKDYIERTYGLMSTVNPDPTFLLAPTKWEEIEKEYDGLPNKFLLLYTIQNSDKAINFASEVSKKLKLPVVQISNERGFKALLHKTVDCRLMDVAPQQFLWLFHHATYIVTNTFHGNMFSIIFRKNFVHFSINKNDSRVSSLHDIIGLGKSRFADSIESFDQLDLNIQYNMLEDKINSYRLSGISFLKDALT